MFDEIADSPKNEGVRGFFRYHADSGCELGVRARTACRPKVRAY